MAINKKKVGKKVFFDFEIWKVEQIISPTKFDDYLLLSQKREDFIYPDDKTHPVDMTLIHAHNDTFYPYNKKTKKTIDLLLKKIKEDKSKEHLEKSLEQKWLACFPNDF